MLHRRTRVSLAAAPLDVVRLPVYLDLGGPHVGKLVARQADARARLLAAHVPLLVEDQPDTFVKAVDFEGLPV